MTLAARLGGHLVQGHVDGVGEVVARSGPTGPAARRSDLRMPEALLRYMVEKGSLTVDGVSLTVAEAPRDGVDHRADPAHARA